MLEVIKEALRQHDEEVAEQEHHRHETRGWLKEQGVAAGGAPSKSQYFSAELEEAYSAAMLAMVRRPEWYKAHGRDGPPHSVEHSSLAERLASMKVIR